jgi:NADH-quinone oxidoreductase subunit D
MIGKTIQLDRQQRRVALGAERLFGIRSRSCKVLRVIASELSRIMSHLVWLGTFCIDIGAFTPFLWAFQRREEIYRLIEKWVGARLTTTATRVGGMAADIPSGWMDGLRQFIRTFPHTLDEIDRVLTRNAIWVGRTVGLGVMTPEEAINWGLSGPICAPSGVDYDVRKDFPVSRLPGPDFDRACRNEWRRLRSLSREIQARSLAFCSRRLTGCRRSGQHR